MTYVEHVPWGNMGEGCRLHCEMDRLF